MASWNKRSRGPSGWAEAVFRAEGGDGLFQLLADLVDTIRFRSIDRRTDRRDQAAIGCQQGGGHGERVRESDSPVEGQSARPDFGELGEELLDLARLVWTGEDEDGAAQHFAQLGDELVIE